MGGVYLVGYIASIGVATYLMKVTLGRLDAFQVNLLMGIAMVAVSLPAVLVVDRRVAIPRGQLGIGSAVAILMAVGSILYALALQRLPAGPAAAIATAYVVVVVVLSASFLHEPIDALTVVGLVLTLSGVAVLSLRA